MLSLNNISISADQINAVKVQKESFKSEDAKDLIVESKPFSAVVVPGTLFQVKVTEDDNLKASFVTNDLTGAVAKNVMIRFQEIKTEYPADDNSSTEVKALQLKAMQDFLQTCQFVMMSRGWVLTKGNNQKTVISIQF